jgi:coniferyl-aldehyde dehydrogenase
MENDMRDSFEQVLVQSFNVQRSAFLADMNPDIQRRRDRLDRLLRMAEQNEQAIIKAIDADFGHRSSHETRLAEIGLIATGVRHAKAHLKRWMSTRRVPTAMHYLPGRNRLMRQPLGVVGIVAPWNYPYQLSIGPATGALAAGNRVMIKPSELTPRFSALLADMVHQHFDPAEMTVVTGDADMAKAFVSLPFDHLLFTGSTAVGRQVAQAAAKNLTPVTLELGGKSPAIVDASCDLSVMAPRLAFGKLINAGQTCIAPDYLMLHQSHADALPALLEKTIGKLYPTLAANPDYTSIVSDHHYRRLHELLADAESKGAKVISINPAGEKFNPETRKMAPALVLNATSEMRVMQEEIFGPVLPVMTFDRIEEAISHVNEGERPLALYWFGTDNTHRDKVLHNTISGGVTVNDCIWHITQEAQPFGGVGASGSGAYHGEWGFRTFTMEKPVFIQPRFNGLSMLYPPYGKKFEALMAVLKRIA